MNENADQFESVVVVIPALNEEESIGMVLNDLPKVGRVIVVDNGSQDQTAAIANEKGAVVVSESKRGYGAACLAGLREAKRIDEKEQPVQVIAFVDADYSDHVHLLGQLIQPILDDEFDFVIGSRMTGKRERGAMPPQALFGNWLACTLMRLFFHARYTDLGPMRAVRHSSLKQIGMVDENFGWTIEMQIKARKHQLRTQEIPVPYRRRIGVSKISGTISGTFKAGTKILYSIWLYRK